MTNYGPYSKEIFLARPDGRTKEARLLKKMRHELAQHCGGNLSVTQRALIERAAMLQLRCAKLDQRLIQGGEFTEHDSRTYLAWSNSLARTLRVLGLQPGQLQQPSLAEVLRSAGDAV